MGKSGGKGGKGSSPGRSSEDPTEADREALREAFAGVKPLSRSSKKRVMPKPENRPAPVRGGRGARGGPSTEERLIVQHERHGTVLGHRKNAHASIIDALEDPRLEIEASCDLHGRTATEAEREVARFLRECQQRGDRWVLVIVGKGLHSPGGQGALKDHIVDVLSKGAAARFVLAFRTAPQRLGGDGAIAIRLVDRL